MAIASILIGVVVLAAGMFISDIFTESVDKAWKKLREPNDPG